MLKRQRPSTPPLSLDDTLSLTLFPDRPLRPLPYREAPQNLSSHEPRVKKRRLHPPVLDGAQRGWGKSFDPLTLVEDNSDGEEDWIDGEDDVAAAYAYSHVATSPDYTGYKHTNSMLHEVHALHQHRLMSSQPSSQKSPHLNMHVPMTIHHPLYSTHEPRNPLSSSSGGKGSIPALPECPSPELYSHLAHLTSAASQSAATSPWDFREVKSVRERYEDTNKFLGSLFLLRRRELESATLVAEEGHSDLQKLL